MVRRARPGSLHAQFGYTEAEIPTQGADFLPGDLQVTFQACKKYKRWQKYLPENSKEILDLQVLKMITGNRHTTIISYIKLCVVPPGDVVVRYDVGR